MACLSFHGPAWCIEALQHVKWPGRLLESIPDCEPKPKASKLEEHACSCPMEAWPAKIVPKNICYAAFLCNDVSRQDQPGSLQLSSAILLHLVVKTLEAILNKGTSNPGCRAHQMFCTELRTCAAAMTVKDGKEPGVCLLV